MYEFTYETQGVNTYMVYTIKETDEIDTLSLGMISNNKIQGVSPIVFTQMDEERFLKYNISAKVSLDQFFTGTVNRQRLLSIFESMASTMLEAEEYMIDTTDFLLDTKHIYVDVSSSKAMLICLPVIKADAQYDISTFFRNIVFSTQFDQNENCDYVARLINYFNSSPIFSIPDFYELVKNLQKNNGLPIPQQVQTSTEPQSRVSASSANAKAIIQHVQPVVQKTQQNSSVTTIQVAKTEIEASQENKEDKKKKTLFSFSKKEKNDKTDKKKNKQEKDVSSDVNFEIPGSVPGAGTQNHAQQSGAVQKEYEQNVQMEQSVPVQSVSVQSPVQRVQQQSLNFGNTTVLSQGRPGQTTVLSVSTNVVGEVEKHPYLIRQKTSERIDINKPLFKIGKEKSYVDYFIGDNPAISRSHANIITEQDQYFIMDTNSTNHTYVNGTRIPSNQNCVIEHGDEIRIADENYEFKTY